MSPKNKKSDVKVRNTGVIVGVDKHLTGTVTLGGTAYTPDELKAVFQADNDAIDETDASHKKLEESVQKERAVHVTTQQVLSLLRNYLLGLHGPLAVTVLGDFGMSPPKSKTKKTAASKAAAVERGKATRKVRNTMGKKQKKSVKSAPVTMTTAPAKSASEPAVPALPAGVGGVANSATPAGGSTTTKS